MLDVAFSDPYGSIPLTYALCANELQRFYEDAGRDPYRAACALYAYGFMRGRSCERRRQKANKQNTRRDG